MPVRGANSSYDSGPECTLGEQKHLSGMLFGRGNPQRLCKSSKGHQPEEPGAGRQNVSASVKIELGVGGKDPTESRGFSAISLALAAVWMMD